MATFVAMFYSQRSRKLLINASKYWDKSKPLFKILDFILHNKYKKNSSKDDENYEYFFTEFVYFIILLFLNKENSKTFPYDPYVDGDKGFLPEFYIGKLYRLLNIDYRMYDYNTTQDILAYSIINDEFDRIITFNHRYSNSNSKLITTYLISVQHYNAFRYVEPNYPPSVLLVNINVDNTCFNYNNYYKNIINDSKKRGI